MKLTALILSFLFFSNLFAQYSSIIDFPVTTYQYTGSPVFDPDSGDSVSFDLKVYYSIPENPVGIIYFFHGSGGGGLKWLLHVEQPYLLMEAYHRGYGIVTMDSNDRVNKQWGIATDQNGDPIAVWDTPDTEHVWMVNQNLIALGKYAPQTPLFTIGFSNGSSFASRLALRASTFFMENQDQFDEINNIVPLNAVALNGAVGFYTISQEYDKPSIFNVGINDKWAPVFPNMTWHPKWPYDPDETVIFHYQNLVNNNIDAELNVKPEETVSPYTFTIIPGVDTTGSVAIYDTLKAIMDQNGQFFISDLDSLNYNPSTTSFWHSYIPPEHQNKFLQIEQQLNVVYAEHVVLRQYRETTIDFFDNYLMTTSVDKVMELDEAVLGPNFPNPFTNQTTIPFSVLRTSHVKLEVFDLYGHKIETLVDQVLSPGPYWASWKINSSVLSSGIYICILKNAEKTASLKIHFIN